MRAALEHESQKQLNRDVAQTIPVQTTGITQRRVLDTHPVESLLRHAQASGVKRRPFGAGSAADGPVRLLAERDFGCGRCASECPAGAIALIPRSPGAPP